MRSPCVQLLFVLVLLFALLGIQFTIPTSRVNAISDLSLKTDSTHFDGESPKPNWSYRTFLTFNPVDRRTVGTGLQAPSSASSNGLQLASPVNALPLSSPTLSPTSLGGQPSLSSLAGKPSISDSSPSIGTPVFPPTPVIANSQTAPSSAVAPTNPVGPGFIPSSTPDVTKVQPSSVTPITSVMTADGNVWSYSATFIASQTSITTISTSQETDAAGAVFGVINFPGTGGRGWKFPCLINCGGGFSLPGPPPGFGPLSGGGRGGGGGAGGSAGGGGGGGGGSNGNDSTNEDDKNDNEDERKSGSQTDSTTTDTTSTSSSSSACSSQTASSCAQTCPPVSAGSSATCFETCILSTGCSVTNTATTTTETCSSMPCQTIVVTTIGGTVTSETYCLDCTSTATEVTTDPAESGWASKSSSYVTLITVTVVTEGGFVHPDFMLNTAQEYSQMSLMDKEIAARHTKPLSTLITSATSLSSSNAAQKVLSSSRARPPPPSVSVNPELPTDTPIFSPSPVALPTTTTTQPNAFSDPPAAASSGTSPILSTSILAISASSSSSPTSQLQLAATTSAPVPTAEPITQERPSTTATRGECNLSPCAGISRDEALKRVKKFCSTRATINLKTTVVASTASLTGLVTLPTKDAGQYVSADLYMAIELDGKDDRCMAVEYINRPKLDEPALGAYNYVSNPVGPNELCMTMMQTALDHCEFHPAAIYAKYFQV
ncbi:hypothetical protein DL95DRAFT_461919 [Leptodontidium sp. 2 PMI_412]|nr:hypothetical protein DL95DRAFT_461919 [Leptodontidium sp. 2 PMI_412]